MKKNIITPSFKPNATTKEQETEVKYVISKILDYLYETEQSQTDFLIELRQFLINYYLTVK